MGTLFSSALEAPIHFDVKEAICAASEHNTELVMRGWNNTLRLFCNKVSKESIRVENSSKAGQFEDIAPLFVESEGGRSLSMVTLTLVKVPDSAFNG